MALCTHVFDGRSYSQLTSGTAADRAEPVALAFHVFPTLPFTPDTGLHDVLLIAAQPDRLASRCTTVSLLTLSLRSYDRRLLVAVDRCNSDDVATGSSSSVGSSSSAVILVSSRPIRAHAWTSIELRYDSSSHSLTLTIIEQLSASSSVCSCSSLASPFPQSCTVHLGGSPAHAPAAFFTGYLACLSLSRLASIPPAPLFPVSSALPALPTRALPLRSFAALSASPFSPLLVPAHAGIVRRSAASSRPPFLLHCHDLRGGYTDDFHPQGLQSSASCSYAFSHWAEVDVLVYFSHHRITVPPSAFVVAAHKDGVRVLGTIITEWEEGERENERLLLQGGAASQYAQSLVRLCQYHRFDGWLVNMEAALRPQLLPDLMSFLSTLRSLLHAAVPHALLLWYDSLSASTGRVQWQSALHSEHTLPFLHRTDGVFLDYHWQPQQIVASSAAARDRRWDVFTGIDVWGRGTWGGGGWSVGKALQVVMRGGEEEEMGKQGSETGAALTSVALFGAGWTLEALGVEQDRGRWEMMERKLWLGEDVIELDVAGDGSECKTVEQAMAGWQLLGEEEGEDAGREDGAHLMQRWALVDDDAKGCKVLVTSHRRCRRRREVDLLSVGIPPAMLASSPLLLSLPYRGSPPNCADSCHLSVSLLSASRTPLLSRSLSLTCAAEWRTASLSLLCPSARYLLWEEGGQDAEGWAGHYGCRLGGGRLQLRAGRRQGGVSDFITRRARLSLPMLHDFNAGCGKRRWRAGELLELGAEADWERPGCTQEVQRSSAVSDCGWSNLEEQDVQSTLCDGIRGGQTFGCFTCALTDDAAYEGGRCVSVTVAPGEQGEGSREEQQQPVEEEAEFAVLQFDTSEDGSAEEAEDLLIRATVKETSGTELGLVLLLSGGRRLQLRGETSCSCVEVNAGWKQYTTTLRLRRADISGISLRVVHTRSSSSPSVSVSYFGQLYINTVAAHRSLQSRVCRSPSLPALLHWPIRSASSPQLVTLYLVWLPPLALSDGDVVHYELHVDGRYVGSTRRCAFVMEDRREDSLQQRLLTVSCRYSDGQRSGTAPNLRLRLRRAGGEEEKREAEVKAAFAACFCSELSLDVRQWLSAQCSAMGLDSDDEEQRCLQQALRADCEVRLGSVSSEVRDCVTSVCRALGIDGSTAAVNMRQADGLPVLVVMLPAAAERQQTVSVAEIREQLVAALSSQQLTLRDVDPWLSSKLLSLIEVQARL